MAADGGNYDVTLTSETGKLKIVMAMKAMKDFKGCR
jgi:hypothetical protein